jgi:hypothetical protein
MSLLSLIALLLAQASTDGLRRNAHNRNLYSHFTKASFNLDGNVDDKIKSSD